MPGWYYWIIPFIAYFYSKQQRYTKRLFVILNALYFLYFIGLDYISDPILTNLIFTGLQLFLAVNTILIYKWGIKSILKSKLNYIPYLIGIGGDSGVGKTTLSTAILGIFGDKDTLVVRGDDMHRWERGHLKWKTITHLSPKANKLHENYVHLSDLKNHRKIKRSFYDHASGKFTNPELLKSKKIIIFEGLHPFYLKRNRELYDFKIFIEPDEKLRLHWKIIRDIEKRGYTKETVLDQLNTRENDSLQYIKPQSKYADMLITYYNRKEFSRLGDINEEIDLALKIKMDNSIYIEHIIHDFSKIDTINVNHNYEENFQTVDIWGLIDNSEIEQIFVNNISEIEDYIDIKSDFFNNYQGILQVLVTYYILMVTKSSNA